VLTRHIKNASIFNVPLVFTALKVSSGLLIGIMIEDEELTFFRKVKTKN
jgi:hypothetical protein